MGLLRPQGVSSLCEISWEPIERYCMQESIISQDTSKQEFPTPKQFRDKFMEIYASETTFGSPRAARLKLLEAVLDIIEKYLSQECCIVYLHGKLKEAGYSGSRKELTEWLVEKGMWTKREIRRKEKKNGENAGLADTGSAHSNEIVITQNSNDTTQGSSLSITNSEKKAVKEKHDLITNDHHVTTLERSTIAYASGSSMKTVTNNLPADKKQVATPQNTIDNANSGTD